MFDLQLWEQSVKCLGLNLLQAFPSLASPPPSVLYYSHSLPVSFPSRKVLETPGRQANMNK